jgi:hypothetical protein
VNQTGNKRELPAKKKYGSVILFLWFFFSYCPAQPFSKLYYDGHPSMLFGSVQVVGDNAYVTGVTTTVRYPYREKTLFGKIGLDSSVLFINSIVDSDSIQYDIFLNSLKKTADGNFIITGEMIDTADKAFLLKVDTVGNILLWHEYSSYPSKLFQGTDVEEIPGNGYIITVNKEDMVYHNTVYVIRTDTSGNVLNQMDYDHASQEEPWVVRPMLNHDFMIGAVSFKAPFYTPVWTKTWLIEVDSMGNRVTEWIDSNAVYGWPYGMEQTADSGWIIVRQHLMYDSVDFQAYNGSILKLDKNFHQEWQIDTGGFAGEAGMYDVKILPDGSYICVGADPININQDSSHIYGWLMKVSPTGQIIWQHAYLAYNDYTSFSYLNSVALLPDGGFLACGKNESALSNPAQQAWILRTDSMGCVMSRCGDVQLDSILGISEITSSTTVTVFPNPSQGNVIIRLENNFSGPLEVGIFNELGENLFRQTLTHVDNSINLSNYPSGIYFYSIDGKEFKKINGKFVIVK